MFIFYTKISRNEMCEIPLRCACGISVPSRGVLNNQRAQYGESIVSALSTHLPSSASIVMKNRIHVSASEKDC